MSLALSLPKGPNYHMQVSVCWLRRRWCIASFGCRPSVIGSPLPPHVLRMHMHSVCWPFFHFASCARPVLEPVAGEEPRRTGHGSSVYLRILLVATVLNACPNGLYHERITGRHCTFTLRQSNGGGGRTECRAGGVSLDINWLLSSLSTFTRLEALRGSG